MGALSFLTINTTTETVRDLDLAHALGYGRPDNIRNLIKRKRSMLEEFGTVLQSEAPYTTGNGTVKTSTEFHLNRKQAIYLTTQAGTPKARAMTVFVVSG